MNDEYAAKLTGSYNKQHSELFTQKGAVRKFMGPVNLHMSKTSPPPRFGSNKARLTKDEEFNLFSAMHFMRFKLENATNKKNFGRYFQVYLALRNRVISANSSLVPTMVSRYSRGYYDTDALKSAGNKAFISAADNFDPWKGVKFGTYACNAICRAMWREMKNGYKIQTRFRTAELVEIPTEVEDSNEALWLEKVGLIWNGPNDLNDQERKVLDLRFREGLTLMKIGLRIGVCFERVRQIKLRAIWKIKKVLKEDPVLNEDAVEYSILEEHFSRLSA